jgi:hypothetical protein
VTFAVEQVERHERRHRAGEQDPMPLDVGTLPRALSEVRRTPAYPRFTWR